MGKAEWINGDKRRYVLDADDIPELERDAGNNEFIQRMPRLEAEDKAYSDYKTKHHAKAAAHHLTMMRAASAAGAHNEAKRHKLIYDLHLKALGYDPTDHKVPDKVQTLVTDPDRNPGMKFQPHKADTFLLDKNDNGTYLGEELAKAEVRKPNPTLRDVLREPPREDVIDLYRKMRPDYLKATLGRMVNALNSPAAQSPALHSHIRALHHLVHGPVKKEEFKDTFGDTIINYNDPKSIKQAFGSNAIPRGFDPANIKHWGEFIAGLSPTDRAHVAHTLFSYDREKEKRGLKPTTLSDIRRNSRKIKKGDVGGEGSGTPPSNTGMWMSEAYKCAPEEVKPVIRKALLNSVGELEKNRDYTERGNPKEIAEDKEESARERAKQHALEDKEDAKKVDKAESLVGPNVQGYSKEPYKPAISERHKQRAAEIVQAIIQAGRKKAQPTEKAEKEPTYPKDRYIPSEDGRCLNCECWQNEHGKSGACPVKKADKPYMGRDEGIRRQKLPPGAPGADKAGVGVQIDKKKKAAKEAARKWKHGKDD